MLLNLSAVRFMLRVLVVLSLFRTPWLVLSIVLCLWCYDWKVPMLAVLVLVVDLPVFCVLSNPAECLTP